MKILFTGASSFTGMWFVKELVSAGHHVTTPLFRPSTAYSGIRQKRVNQLPTTCDLHFDCPFGSKKFLDIISNGGPWDLLCHHAADVTNYKSPDFDVAKAVQNNTNNLENVLRSIQEHGCNRFLLTGSVFEQNEGKGTYPLQAVSPYGISKGLTSDVIKSNTQKIGMHFDKFVIPNPFGPYEEMRFTTFLIQTWYQGKIADVYFPEYIRDNIHVSLLAKAYLNFAEKSALTQDAEKYSPSGYVQSQGDFTKRFANEMQKRLRISCEYNLHQQHLFKEPLERVNIDPISTAQLNWDETRAWDQLAEFYHSNYSKGP